MIKRWFIGDIGTCPLSIQQARSARPFVLTKGLLLLAGYIRFAAVADRLDAFVSVSSDAFRAETAVMDRLTSRAEKYIAAIGVILAFHVVEFPTLKFKAGTFQIVSLILVVVGLVFLAVALILALHSMRLQDYVTFSTSDKLCKLDEATINDDVVKRSVALLYLDLRDQTLAKNQARARGIIAAGYCLLGGFVLSLAGQLIVRFVGSSN